MLEIEEKFPDQRIPHQGRGWLNFLEPGFLQRLNFNSRVGTTVGGGEGTWQEDVESRKTASVRRRLKLLLERLEG